LGVARILAITIIAAAVVKLLLSGDHQTSGASESILLGGLWEATTGITYWGLILLIPATVLTAPDSRRKLTTLFAFALVAVVICLCADLSGSAFSVRS
jgi:hypothetical protein